MASPTVDFEVIVDDRATVPLMLAEIDVRILKLVWAHKGGPTGEPKHVLEWIDLVWMRQDYEERS